MNYNKHNLNFCKYNKNTRYKPQRLYMPTNFRNNFSDRNWHAKNMCIAKTHDIYYKKTKKTTKQQQIKCRDFYCKFIIKTT